MAGFTSKNWYSPLARKYEKDSSAMLMNLTSSQCFPSKNDDLGGIQCFQGVGPSFGYCELIVWAPFNQEGNLISFVGKEGYGIPKDKALLGPDKNSLTGGKVDKNGQSQSTIVELEVWQIKINK